MNLRLRMLGMVVGPALLLLHGPDAGAMLVGGQGLAAAVAAWIALVGGVALDRSGAGRRLVALYERLDPGFARIGAAMVAVLLAVALLGPVLATHPPQLLGDAVSGRYLAPSIQHWMGTDLLGRDLYSRVVHGARVSLGIALASVVVSVGLGTLVGAAAGWKGGLVDTLLMRFTDLALAFPRIFLVLLLVAFVQPAPGWIVVVLGVTGWMGVARLVRGGVLQSKQEEYVLAARALGLPALRVVARHVLPATAGPVIAVATLRIGSAILAESFLSFLGLGVTDPWVSWGLLIRSGRDMLLGAWWLALFPGVAIVITVVAFNLLGDGLRDAFDPRRGAPGGLEEGL